MCNRYVSPEEADIERFWHIGRRKENRWWEPTVTPLSIAPFLKLSPDGLELSLGQWGLIPPWSISRIPRMQSGARMSTNNARSERVASAPTFRDAWRKGQRCIIPVATFDEPCWETGRCVWWRFSDANSHPLGLAGIWSNWVDPDGGEVVESYAMLTVNADHHPLMGRMVLVLVLVLTPSHGQVLA